MKSSIKTALVGMGFCAFLFSFAAFADTPPAVVPAQCPKDCTPPPPPPAPPPPVWSGDLSLGYVRTSGNASASTFTGKIDLDYLSGPWENTFFATALAAKSNGVTTDEKYSVGDKQLYNLDPKQYVFAQANYDNDRFGGVPQRYSAAVGYGRHVIKTATQMLDLDIGAGGNHTREQGSDQYDNEVIGTFDGVYTWIISPTSQFKQSLRTEFAGNNTYVNPITELKLNIVRNLFVSLDYELRYNSSVPAGTFHTDQITSVNIGYGFGKLAPKKAP